MRKCSNCKNRWFHSWGGFDYCIDYEMACTEEEYIKNAAGCPQYELETEEDREEYTPSSTAGDYGPGNPWDAPGMSIHDFI